MRICAHTLLRKWYMHLPVKLYGVIHGFFMAHTVYHKRLGHLSSGAVYGIERIKRILKYHSYLPASYLLHLCFGY